MFQDSFLTENKIYNVAITKFIYFSNYEVKAFYRNQFRSIIFALRYVDEKDY